MKIKPIHPGEILFKEFIKPFGISKSKLAVDINVPIKKINDIINCVKSITPDIALQLSNYFKTTPEFWLNLQIKYNLEIQRDNLKKQIKKEVFVC